MVQEGVWRFSAGIFLGIEFLIFALIGDSGVTSRTTCPCKVRFRSKIRHFFGVKCGFRTIEMAPLGPAMFSV